MPLRARSFEWLVMLMGSVLLGPIWIGPALLGPALAAELEARQPNVVILLADDLGYQDVGCYGGPVHTPMIDRLAANGTRFTDFYSGAAVCSPSRATLLTGRQHVRMGIYSWIQDNWQAAHLPRSEVTVAEVLRDAGYQTFHAGKWHVGMATREHEKPSPGDHGFDSWFATANNASPSHEDPTNFIRNGVPVGIVRGYSCDLVVDEAIDWLQNERDADKPYFLNLWFHEPHAPLAAPEELVKKYGTPGSAAAKYSATIENTDRAIERLVAKLHELDSPEDTLIIYSSDNGSYRSDRVGSLRGTKGSNYEGGIRVPGIFHWPGKIPGGTLRAEPAGLVDLLPTICGLVGTSCPDGVHLDGCDLSPLLIGEAKDFSRPQPLVWLLPSAAPTISMRAGDFSLVGYRDYEFPRDRERLGELKREIEATLRSKGVFESEVGDSTLDKQMFEGFRDSEAERLRGKFIRLNSFQESWIPTIKSGGFNRFELYNVRRDPGQKDDLSKRDPVRFEEMKQQLVSISRDILTEAKDWGSSHDPSTTIHRLESEQRSALDAFAYVNRIPFEPEADERQDDLAGRILGRLANQEGRVLVKLPPTMNQKAYEGFKLALGDRDEVGVSSCTSCHQLPHFGQAEATPPIPSLRNRSLTREEVKAVLEDETHNMLIANAGEAELFHALLQTLRDQSDARFRELIIGAKVLDTLGDTK